MPDSDVSLDILIRTLADTVGADKVEAALGRVKVSAKENGEALDSLSPATKKYIESLKEGGEQAEHMHISHRALRTVLGQIDPELAHMGHMIMTGLTNPYLAAAIGAIAVAEGMKRIREEMIPETADIGVKSLSHSFEEARDAMFEAQAALLEYHEALKQAASAEANLSQDTAAANAMLEAQSKAAAAGNDAQKQLALAQLELGKATGKVSDAEYSRKKVEIENEADRKKVAQDKYDREERIANEYREADKDSAESKRLQQQVPGLSEAAELATSRQKQLERLIEDAKANETAYLQLAHKRGLSEAEFESRRKNAEVLTQAQQELPEAKAAAKAAQDALTQAEQGAVSLKNKAAALKDKAYGEAQANEVTNKSEADALDKRIKARQADLDTQTLNSPIGQAAISDVTQAEQTAKALREHKTVSDQSKEQLVEIASAVAGHKVSLQQAVGMMGVAAQNMGVFTQDTVRLAQAMSAIASGHSALKGHLEVLEAQVRQLQKNLATRTLPGGG